MKTIKKVLRIFAKTLVAIIILIILFVVYLQYRQTMVPGIKPVPKWFVRTKIAPERFSMTLYPYVYLRQDRYDQYASGKMPDSTIATIVHEKVHLIRQKSIGLTRYLFCYFSSPTFCFEEEMLADSAELHTLKMFGSDTSFNYEFRASEFVNGPWFYKTRVSKDSILRRLKSYYK